MNAPTSAHTPLVSILIPTYNRPGYLDECLYSILNQDFKDYEIIVKDNHSDDIEGYARVIKKYQRLFNKGVVLKYVRNDKNLGVVGNKHEGVVKDCKGKYCLIVDDDDFFLTNKMLSLYVRMFQSTDGVAIVTGEVKRFYERAGSPSIKGVIGENARRPISGKTRIIDGNEYFLGFWNRFGPKQCNVSMFDRQLALERGWPDVECNDQSIHLLLAPGNKVAIFSDELACYRIHDSEDQKGNERRTTSPQLAFNSHTAIVDWVRNAKKYSNISRFSLFIWRLKNIILKDEGPIRWLHDQNESKLNEFLVMLKKYNYLHYVVLRYLSPQMIIYDYHAALKSKSWLGRFFRRIIPGARWIISRLILKIDRVLHDT